MASYNGVQAAVLEAVLNRPGYSLILARSLLRSKNARVAGIYPRSYSQALCLAYVSIGASQGATLWYSRVPVGDVTCELYCN